MNQSGWGQRRGRACGKWTLHDIQFYCLHTTKAKGNVLWVIHKFVYSMPLQYDPDQYFIHFLIIATLHVFRAIPEYRYFHLYASSICPPFPFPSPLYLNLNSASKSISNSTCCGKTNSAHPNLYF